MDFHRNVLVLSEVVPETAHAGSLILHRLLKGCPADRLLVMGPPPRVESEILDCRYETLEVPLQRLEHTRFSRWVRTLRFYHGLPRPSVVDVRKRLKGFRPDVVVTVMQVEAYYALAARFASAESIPLVLLVHDLAETFEPVLPFAQRAQRRGNASIYRAAARRFCISPAMSEHLRDAYGAPGEVFYPNRSEETTPRDLAESGRLKSPPALTLGYAGSLGYGYGRQLERMLQPCARAGVRLRLYSAGRLPQDSAAVEYAGRSRTPEETWARIKDECDAVVLPYCWDADHAALYETHFPSKLPEFLALKMPVAILGPTSASGVRWAVDHPGSALTITEPSGDAWTDALRRLREDADLRVRLAARGWEAGAESFDPAQIRRRFVSALNEAARPNPVTIPGETGLNRA